MKTRISVIDDGENAVDLNERVLLARTFCWALKRYCLEFYKKIMKSTTFLKIKCQDIERF
jgi:hypothetical protein